MTDDRKLLLATLVIGAYNLLVVLGDSLAP